MPPVLAVMTHIDLLSPALEWAPPYNWQEPERPKERQIQEALTAVREQLPAGAYLELFVKVDKDWQRRPKALQRLGY